MTLRAKLVLASGSPRRLALLAQMQIEPDAVLPADLDETPKRGETMRALVLRLARDKAAASLLTAQSMGTLGNPYILSADTGVSCAGRMLPKAETVEDAVECLRLLSGRQHRVLTGIAVMTPNRSLRTKLVETRVRFKVISNAELDAYLAAGEWRGKAGGYAIQGLAAAFVTRLVGSYSNVVGLPIAETLALLEGEGYPVRAGWVGSA